MSSLESVLTWCRHHRYDNAPLVFRIFDCLFNTRLNTYEEIVDALCTVDPNSFVNCTSLACRMLSNGFNEDMKVLVSGGQAGFHVEVLYQKAVYTSVMSYIPAPVSSCTRIQKEEKQTTITVQNSDHKYVVRIESAYVSDPEETICSDYIAYAVDAQKYTPQDMKLFLTYISLFHIVRGGVIFSDGKFFPFFTHRYKQKQNDNVDKSTLFKNNLDDILASLNDVDKQKYRNAIYAMQDVPHFYVYMFMRLEAIIIGRIKQLPMFDDIAPLIDALTPYLTYMTTTFDIKPISVIEKVESCMHV